MSARAVRMNMARTAGLWTWSRIASTNTTNSIFLLARIRDIRMARA
jgi:hypothetical protein